MSIVLDGTAGITTPEITSSGGPLVVNASAPDNSVVVDASGNVGIGTSSPDDNLAVITDGNTTAEIGSAGTGQGSRLLSFDRVAGTSQPLKLTGSILTVNTGTGAGSERMRIDSSGNLLVGTTVNGRTDTNGTAIDPTGVVYQNHAAGTVSGTFFTRFSLAATQIGSISQSGTTAVAYTTSSDYRLKHDIAPMTGALAKVAALKPCTYKWNADDSNGEGFIAHELAEVVPQCVTGEKDAVDADGNPQYQGIDTSFLVATLTAAIQEQQALIESLTARVVALEGA